MTSNLRGKPRRIAARCAETRDPYVCTFEICTSGGRLPLLVLACRAILQDRVSLTRENEANRRNDGERWTGNDSQRTCHRERSTRGRLLRQSDRLFCKCSFETRRRGDERKRRRSAGADAPSPSSVFTCRSFISFNDTRFPRMNTRGIISISSIEKARFPGSFRAETISARIGIRLPAWLPAVTKHRISRTFRITLKLR